MKMISYAAFGGPEVLQLVDAEEPCAGPGEVRIAVRAAGVNPVDWRFRAGQMQQLSPVDLPAGVGQDASGVVDQVGPGVCTVAVGDAVFGIGTNTYAEHAVLTTWAPVPPGLTFEEAAGYPSVVETALRVLREIDARPGHTILVSGAAGGVGSTVLQIARARGIAVVGTASAANQDYVRSLGAAATTYDDGWVERVRSLGPFDAALDIAGAGVVCELIDIVGVPARVLSIADLDAPRLGARFTGGAGDMSEALAEATRLIVAGRLRIPVAKSYALAEAAAAHTDSEAGHTRGRRAVVVGT